MGSDIEWRWYLASRFTRHGNHFFDVKKYMVFAQTGNGRTLNGCETGETKSTKSCHHVAECCWKRAKTVGRKTLDEVV